MAKEYIVNEEVSQLVMKAMFLAFLINQQTGYCVFITFSGHVADIDIDIRKSKEEYEKHVVQTSFYTSLRDYQKPKEHVKFIQDKLQVLETILKDHDIPYDMCDEVVRKSYEYHF